MKFETHQARHASDTPGGVFEFDDVDDRYLAGFENYPSPIYAVIVGWGRVDGRRTAKVGCVLVGNIITAFVSMWDLFPEKSIDKAGNELIAHLQKQYTWLIVHDTDYDAPWKSHGFTQVPPPEDVGDPVAVWTWGELPEPIEVILKTQRLRWSMNEHRYGGRKEST